MMNSKNQSGKIIAAWHAEHRMPKNPSIEERIQWHLSHAKNCSCRPMPEKLREEIKKRKIKA